MVMDGSFRAGKMLLFVFGSAGEWILKLRLKAILMLSGASACFLHLLALCSALLLRLPMEERTDYC